MKTSLTPSWLSVAIGITFAVVATADERPLPPLSTVPDSPRLPGKFVWADLVTDDAPAARTFYGALLGWTFRDHDGYLIAYQDDRPLAGIFQATRPADRPGSRPRWISFMSVDNVGKAQRTVEKAGGRVLAPARKHPDRGEQAILSDAEGAVFGVVNSSTGDLPDFMASPGEWIWIQLLSRDGRAAAAFYKTLGDYEVIENDSPGAVSDFVLASDGYARATVRTIPKEREKVVPTWLPFVRVASVSASAEQARQLGGRVLLEPKPDVLGGKVALVADPTGAAFGLLEWTQDEPKGDR